MLLVGLGVAAAGAVVFFWKDICVKVVPGGKGCPGEWISDWVMDAIRGPGALEPGRIPVTSDVIEAYQHMGMSKEEIDQKIESGYPGPITPAYHRVAQAYGYNPRGGRVWL